MRKRGKKRQQGHAHRYEQFVEAFLRYLARNLPGFRKYPKDVQQALSSMIFEAPTRYRAHFHHEGHARYTWQELDGLFGRRGFTAINESLGLFDVLKESGREDWSLAEGRTKAYALTDRVSAVRDSFLKGCFRRGSIRLMTQDGKYLKTPPANALAAKNKDGQNRRGFRGLPVTTLVPVNRVQIKKLIVDIQARLLAHDAGYVQGELFSDVPDIAFLRDLQQDAAMIYTKANHEEWLGHVLHRYCEVNSGRVYAEGVANLQNCYRPLREAAMAGLYDLDIENCHYSILAQMAERLGYKCAVVQHYLDNKKLVRESLAAEFGISVQQAKDALIALIYGAKFSKRPSDALPEIFGSVDLATRVYASHLFSSLRDDIAAARKVILAAQEVTRRTISNCRGLTINLDESNERQQLAHLLQGIEVAALEAAYRLYPTEIVLLQHDGFSSTRKLDTDRIEAAILDATGYTLKVEQKVIQVNLGDAFNAHSGDANNQNEMACETNIGAGSSHSLAS